MSNKHIQASRAKEYLDTQERLRRIDREIKAIRGLIESGKRVYLCVAEDPCGPADPYSCGFDHDFAGSYMPSLIATDETLAPVIASLNRRRDSLVEAIAKIESGEAEPVATQRGPSVRWFLDQWKGSE